jgi:hypothetical protein
MKKIYYHFNQWEDYQNGMFKKKFNQAWEADTTKFTEYCNDKHGENKKHH